MRSTGRQWTRTGPGVAGVVAAYCLLGALGLATAPASGSGTVGCAYVEAGAPGPVDNVLEITDYSDQSVLGNTSPPQGTLIFREGDEIKVGFGGFSVLSALAGHLVTCTGGTPSVNNVDRIDYSAGRGGLLVSERRTRLGSASSGGPLGPGATLEAAGSEIEINVRESGPHPFLQLDTGDEPDSVQAGRTGGARAAFNLHASSESLSDPDVLFFGDAKRLKVKVRLGGGNDRFSAAGGSSLTGPLQIGRLTVDGSDGSDVLAGSPGRDLIKTGAGNDIARGGASKDLINIGTGHDVARGGGARDSIFNESAPGGDDVPDAIFGGAGNDEITVWMTLADKVNCGSGRDLAIVDRLDRLKGCERVQRLGSPPPSRP